SSHACMYSRIYLISDIVCILQLFGAAIMGFGLWLLLDNQSFIVVLNNSPGVKLACYILIGVGAFSMLLSFLGCLGAIYEIRCLLGLYFTCLLLILIAQIAAGVLLYFQKDVVSDLGVCVCVCCCGWIGRMDWSGNMVIINSSQLLFPCSCQNISLVVGNFSGSGFCEAQTPDWPVYDVGCAASVERWLHTNIAVVLSIYLGVALIELLGMILSICLCRNIPMELYTKVPKN
uniref:CD82 molecule a n=1 Tax=Amphilophus citrinellus TaxID=61819 RepID=A0A3Q0R294_AMPCI